MVSEKLLVEYGFLSSAGKLALGGLSDEERKKAVKQLSKDAISRYADMEMQEIHTSLTRGNRPTPSGYPPALRNFFFKYDSPSLSLEKFYFWVFNHITTEQGYARDEVIKITDIFSASEMSSYWGVSAQRLSIQQDRASQYLKFIADMIKTMFQLIRDLNIVDEKLAYYTDSFGDDPDKRQDAELILKGQFADLVDGGAKNPTSVFGLAQQFQFTTLPNLFFQTNVFGDDEDEVLKGINPKVKEMEFGTTTLKDVLQRKLSQYYRWKFRTFKQLKTYRKLYKSYLKQHYNNIRLYMQWVKPYLRNIRRLSPSEQKTDSAELVAAFEGEMIEIEILAKREVKGNYYGVILANFDFRTSPYMDYLPQFQERRPVMMGKMEMRLKCYAWTDQQIENYRKMKEAEELELLKEIDETIRESMEAMEEDVMKYLQEKDDEVPDDPKVEEKEDKFILKRGKLVKEKEQQKKKAPNALTAGSMLEPFIQVGKGFGMMFSPLKISLPQRAASGFGYEETVQEVKFRLWITYKIFKKANGFITW